MRCSRFEVAISADGCGPRGHATPVSLNGSPLNGRRMVACTPATSSDVEQTCPVAQEAYLEDADGLRPQAVFSHRNSRPRLDKRSAVAITCSQHLPAYGQCPAFRAAPNLSTTSLAHPVHQFTYIHTHPPHLQPHPTLLNTIRKSIAVGLSYLLPALSAPLQACTATAQPQPQPSTLDPHLALNMSTLAEHPPFHPFALSAEDTTGCPELAV